jgi:hypothetical protein
MCLADFNTGQESVFQALHKKPGGQGYRVLPTAESAEEGNLVKVFGHFITVQN